MSHILHCGDGIAGMAAMADRSVDHVITDPPYEAEAHTLQRRIKLHGQIGSVPIRTPLRFGAITEGERTAAAAQMARVALRWILVFCQAEAAHKWALALATAGSPSRRYCVWIKPDGQPQLTGDRPGMGYETIVAAHAPGRSRWNAGGKCGVYSYVRNQDGDHPTQKPLPLMEALISDFTDAGDLVCDPYSGVATTGVACKRLGRSFLGWEIDPGFYEVGRKRLGAAREQFQLPRLAKPRQLPLSVPGNGGEGA